MLRYVTNTWFWAVTKSVALLMSPAWPSMPFVAMSMALSTLRTAPTALATNLP